MAETLTFVLLLPIIFAVCLGLLALAACFLACWAQAAWRYFWHGEMAQKSLCDRVQDYLYG